MFRVPLLLAALLFAAPQRLFADCGPGHEGPPQTTQPEPSAPGPSAPSTVPPEAPTTVEDQIRLGDIGTQSPLPDQGPVVDDAQPPKRKVRVEEEHNDKGKLTKKTWFDKHGNKVKETAYHEDGKTPKEEKEFYKDGATKEERFYDEEGRLHQENEYWPRGKGQEGQERGKMKSATTEHYDADGRPSGTTRHVYDEEGHTIRSDEHSLHGDTVTRYDPKTGNAIDQVTTHSNGKIQSDTRFDRDGNVISQKTFREDGRPESETTHYPDGSSRRQEFNEEGGMTNTHTNAQGDTTTQTYDRRGRLVEQTERHGFHSTTQRFREDRSLESQTQTAGLRTDYKTFDERGKVTSEKTIEHGVTTSDTRHAPDGSTRHTEFNRDGSVRFQTRTAADGSQSTEQYKAGEYFQNEDGSVYHNP